MAAKEVMASTKSTELELFARVPGHYGCGPIELAGTGNALYERHLMFDNVVDLADGDSRERFEAFARSVRDILSQQWIKTEKAYARENPKRIYYLSMEFLIGRSLENNMTNLLLGPLVKQAVKGKNLDWLEILDEEPDAGLGNGGLGRLAACFLDSMATMQLPGMGYGLRYEYGIFKQVIRDGWQQEQPDNWLRLQDPWEVLRPHDKVEIPFNCSYEVREGNLRAILGKTSSLIGVPFDRPVVGYGGKTINTLRLWAANAPDYFDFQAFSHGEFVGAVAETLEAESLTRVLYPDDSTSMGQGLRFVQEYFLVACSLADLIRRFRRSNADWAELPEKVAIQLNDTHPTLAVPELMRILLDEAQVITESIGSDWVTDLSQLSKLRTLADDQGFRDCFRKAKCKAKSRFVAWLKSSSGQTVDPNSIFDCQIKRIHEYKRQLLNALRIVVLYNRLRENPDLEMAPRTFFFSGKAAPAYKFAKLIIKFLENLAGTIDGDPAMRDRLQVLFLPEYDVSLAERLIPASDVSNQISTAGYEASGTSNMKFMMNGALTIGTRDGATIEMVQEAGEENFFLFGLTAEQVAGSRGWYSPRWHYENEPEARAALDLIISDYFSRNEPGVFAPLYDVLLTHGDHYMHLADLKTYLEADQRLRECYADPNEWTRKAILNVAASGKFSSDRTIAEYATEIWEVKPCPVA